MWGPPSHSERREEPRKERARISPPPLQTKTGFPKVLPTSSVRPSIGIMVCGGGALNKTVKAAVLHHHNNLLLKGGRKEGKRKWVE